MATVNFKIQGKSGVVPIYALLSNGRNNLFYRKTGLEIDVKNWSKTTGYAKQNDASNKSTNSKLRGLKKEIFDSINESVSKGEIINGVWLTKIIDNHFNKKEEDDLDFLTNYTDKFLKDCKYRTNRNGKKITVSTIKKYTTIANKLKQFERIKNRRYLVKEVDLDFKRDLIEFFYEENKLGEGSIGRYLKTVKTFCLDAQLHGIEVSPQLPAFKGFTVETHKIILSFEELENIKNADLKDKNHIIARDWLIIGCYTGQRVSDLLRMNKSFISEIQSFRFIELTQQKTDKLVQIPIHYEVKNILEKREGEFPPVFSDNMESNKTLFNRYLKQMCEVAEITEIIKGCGYDKELERYIEGDFEKYKLVSSHICRRSFATNFYGHSLYPTPLLMNITGHSKERDFLTYIGKKPIDYGMQLAKIWAKEAQKKMNKKNPKMAVKKVS